MVSWSNLEKLCSCSRTWMVSALACGNKWIQVGTYTSACEKTIYMVWNSDDLLNDLTAPGQPTPFLPDPPLLYFCILCMCVYIL